MCAQYFVGTCIYPLHLIRSQTPAVANGAAEDRSKVDNEERDVYSKQSAQRSGGPRHSIKPEEPQPLVTLTDVKSTYVLCI